MNPDFIDLLRAFAGADVRFIGLDSFIRNKQATGRPKDLADIEELRERH